MQSSITHSLLETAIIWTYDLKLITIKKPIFCETSQTSIYRCFLVMVILVESFCETNVFPHIFRANFIKPIRHNFFGNMFRKSQPEWWMNYWEISSSFAVALINVWQRRTCSKAPWRRFKYFSHLREFQKILITVLTWASMRKIFFSFWNV